MSYYVRFIRRDRQPPELYFYWKEEAAREHLKLFIDDDSGIYEKIELRRYEDDSLIEELVQQVPLF